MKVEIDEKMRMIDSNNVLSELTSQLINSLAKKEDDILEHFLRDNAIPPIKGKLTKGKLKWRGITLHQINHGLLKPIERQLFQRGKPISPLIIITFPDFYNYNNDYIEN